jgi:alkylation response protein AidB-like acyl-CoA dehydrogenase
MSNKSFAETAMELAGKSEEEVKTIGQIDAADDDVEKMFAERHKTINSPIHKAVWGELDISQFAPKVSLQDKTGVLEASYDILKKHQEAGTSLNEDDKHNTEMIQELADVGYFGTLVGLPNKPKMTFSNFIKGLAKNATISPQVAGLSSVHGCIGAVDPIMAFGTPEQKAKFLPRLAAGVQSGFGLTEPNAGSDLTALRTTATLVGDHYVVDGEKLFITNVHLGGILGLVCKNAETGRPMVLIVDLPEEENENFYMKHYGLYALKEMVNVGLVFKDFKVPAENAIQEDGLTVAYHGLNYGRTAVCANANGCMRRMLGSMLPWARFRETYGEKIESRELVQRRVAQMAGYVVGSAALMSWSSRLLDDGYRGEMECIIGKVAGSEWQKNSAIDLCMRTHGGRSFLHGHLIGDNIHELLAPCIYEGEGEMLGMAFFKSLVKNHGKTYYEAMGKAVGKPTLMNIIKGFFKDPKAFFSYGGWKVKNKASRIKVPSEVGNMHERMRPHARYAVVGLKRMAGEIDAAMQKHQLKLADRQCRMSFLSQKTQDLVTILVTSMYGNSVGGQTMDAAQVLCTELEQKINGKHPSDSDYRFMTKLGARIASNPISSLAVVEDEILMPYST